MFNPQQRPRRSTGPRQFLPKRLASQRLQSGKLDLERLKEQLLQRHLAATENLRLRKSIKAAAHEAASMAWLTPFPTLFLPALLEEKAAIAEQQMAHQEKVRARSKKLMLAIMETR